MWWRFKNPSNTQMKIHENWCAPKMLSFVKEKTTLSAVSGNQVGCKCFGKFLGLSVFQVFYYDTVQGTIHKLRDAKISLEYPP
eukprot:UN01572